MKYVAHILVPSILIIIALSCKDEQSAGPGSADTYIKFFGADNSDIAYMSQSTPDGGAILLGTTEVEIEGLSAFKIKIIKVDENGNERWQKVYPPFQPDNKDLEISYIGRSIKVISDGYIIVGDRIKSDDESTPSSLLAMKISDLPTDNTPITLTVDHIDNLQLPTGLGLQGIDITTDTDGNYKVIGNVIDDEEITGFWFATIIDNGTSLSFDPEGCFYNTEGALTLAKSLHETVDGDFIFAGTDKSKSLSNSIIQKVPSCQKSNSGGGVLLVNNPQNDYTTGQVIPTNTGFAMVGTRTTAAGSDIFFSLFESTGVPLENSLTIYQDNENNLPGIGSGDEFGLTIANTDDGGFIIGGYTLSETAGEEDILLIKTNAFGEVQWTKTLGNINQEQANFIQQTPDGGYYIFGNTEFGGIDTMIFIKTDENGDVN